MKTSARIAVLGSLSRRWLDRRFPFRMRAVRRLVRKSGFAPAAAEAMLDALFSELTESKLKRLVRVEAGSPAKLDAAEGPTCITHILSGNIPNPGVQSVVHGLLVRSENRIKPSSRDEGIVDLYWASLRRYSRTLAGSCRMLNPSDRDSLRRSIEVSDLVIAYGSDESVSAVRKRLCPGTMFAGYGHRVSFSIITREAQTPAVARRTALDVWMMDKRGCLSPALIFVEESQKMNRFCCDVLRALEKLEKREGPTRSDPGRAAAMRTVMLQAKLRAEPFLRTKKGRYFIRVSSLSNRQWADAPGADFRFFRRVDDVFRALRRFSPVLQACALECAPSQRKRVSKQLAQLGFNRVCHAGRLQFPPVDWPHDGRPNFADWLCRTARPSRPHGRIPR